MKKSDIQPMPDFFDRYINLVDDITISEALEKHTSFVTPQDIEMFNQLGEKVYAPGKWTIKSILQHLIDTERILSYRALRFARKDSTPLPGFDEQIFADNAEASARSFPDLFDEYNIVRQSSKSLFNSFTDEMLQQKGICFNRRISVLALGFVIAGHPLHHMNIVKEKYYSLLEQNNQQTIEH